VACVAAQGGATAFDLTSQKLHPYCIVPKCWIGGVTRAWRTPLNTRNQEGGRLSREVGNEVLRWSETLGPQMPQHHFRSQGKLTYGFVRSLVGASQNKATCCCHYQLHKSLSRITAHATVQSNIQSCTSNHKLMPTHYTIPNVLDFLDPHNISFPNLHFHFILLTLTTAIATAR